MPPKPSDPPDKGGYNSQNENKNLNINCSKSTDGNVNYSNDNKLVKKNENCDMDTSSNDPPVLFSASDLKLYYIFIESTSTEGNGVSLGKMVIDCVRYTIIFTVLLLSFAAGLARYYSYYEGMKQRNPETGDESSQEQSFVTFWDTLKTLFWGIFGMSSFENADVVIENLPDDMGGKTIINEHILTEFIGYMTFAIYMILTVVVLLNMLIATMSNTFQRVINNVDTEWMFGRTKFTWIRQRCRLRSTSFRQATEYFLQNQLRWPECALGAALRIPLITVSLKKGN